MGALQKCNAQRPRGEIQATPQGENKAHCIWTTVKWEVALLLLALLPLGGHKQTRMPQATRRHHRSRAAAIVRVSRLELRFLPGLPMLASWHGGADRANLVQHLASHAILACGLVAKLRALAHTALHTIWPLSDQSPTSARHPTLKC